MFNLERGLGHMSISELTLKSKDEPVRRFEVFTGNGRRREWSDDQKAQIIAESCEPGVTVCSVARRHPSKLTFASASGGRPELVSPSSAPFRFNLSHADGLVGCVLTQKADCGLDVEQIGRVDYRHLMPTVLAPEERSALLGLAEADRPGRFCEIWTLKEAYLKGRGLGISYPIRNISFSGFDGNRLCRVVGDERDDGSTWHFWSRPVAGAYSAAAAVRTQRDDVKLSTAFIEDLP
ncbi:4'-phosphopantetheinyl transferase superfamily protein [Rhizobium leguminosarum]|uniref:4'-phosphopantetheinyl transferase superfamily protein n=1 Tax=Rhizobium leguminosarum TaxID=384 RepID=UPI001E03C61C|nr:4'-phosphopantetheinyl transferase superfamily protein [Rhizobium leguminosarum]MBY5338588.1 4'-phosphopantetheinyl transferase superfamily protein [Rhizobium leguminosarum]